MSGSLDKRNASKVKIEDEDELSRIRSRAYPSYQDDSKSRKDNSKIPSKLSDPCREARSASHKCLDRNNYDKTMCYDYFEVYRECQKRWLDSRKK
ncbi:hypothetical protein BY996DRAFT_6969692 [Phakopsora pachyrhizi]|nr:hypothetical protein BY996DRAFT_6969692 [Phakopsora pachyrhizi]